MAEDEKTEEDDVEAGLEAMEKLTKPVEEKQAVEATQDTLKLEDVAEILGLEPKRFIEKYQPGSDLDAWYEEANNIYKNRLSHNSNLLGELNTQIEGEFHNAMSKSLEAFIALVRTDRANYIEMGKALTNADKNVRVADALLKINQSFAKLKQDEKNLFLAKATIDYYYLLGVEGQRNSAIEDNSKMAAILKEIVLKSDDIKEVVARYVSRREG